MILPLDIRRAIKAFLDGFERDYRKAIRKRLAKSKKRGLRR